MRMVIKDIIKILDCDEDFANKVEYQMQCNAFDFSEETHEAFKREVLMCWADLGRLILN